MTQDFLFRYIKHRTPHTKLATYMLFLVMLNSDIRQHILALLTHKQRHAALCCHALRKEQRPRLDWRDGDGLFRIPGGPKINWKNRPYWIFAPNLFRLQSADDRRRAAKKWLRASNRSKWMPIPTIVSLYSAYDRRAVKKWIRDQSVRWDAGGLFVRLPWFIQIQGLGNTLDRIRVQLWDRPLLPDIFQRFLLDPAFENKAYHKRVVPTKPYKLTTTRRKKTTRQQHRM